MAIKITLLILISLALQARPLKVGFFELIPHTYGDQHKKVGGPIIDYFNKVMAEVATDSVDIKLLPLPRLITKLTKKELDIGIFLAKNPKRLNAFDYPRIALYDMVPSIIVSKNFKGDRYNFEDIKICVWEDGYLPEQFKSLKNSLFKMTGELITQRCLEMMKNKRVDAFFSPDHLSLKYHLKKMKLQNDYKVIPVVGDPIGLYTVFSKGHEKLIEKHETALKKVKEQARYEDEFYKFLDSLD
ncbi:ABC transporter substrate-binding protein [Bacteriovorax sp. Seq25_V]|uniref:substrate-binding periplasmic protein n=1 Tax=Bacteriovorax sp. Seq25_V TaxID=1201288 RepID=UPI00038A2CD6|nr:transporter substrate-binding domain-containing protein [Bacteriovorax sp. Seq25_V]EQC47692.1 ABC transporter, substrate-binding protein, family 3 [Bacteriovorax sp. Seq25_V]